MYEVVLDSANQPIKLCLLNNHTVLANIAIDYVQYLHILLAMLAITASFSQVFYGRPVNLFQIVIFYILMYIDGFFLTSV